jgi:hypothetical protein
VRCALRPPVNDPLETLPQLLTATDPKVLPTGSAHLTPRFCRDRRRQASDPGEVRKPHQSRVPVHGCLRAFLQRVGPGFIDLVQDEAGDDWLDVRSETVLRAAVPSQSSTNTARSNMAGYR